jgi:hypothetical protein
MVQKSVPAAADSIENDDEPNAPVVHVNSTIDATQADVSAQVRDPNRKDDAESATFGPHALLLIPAALAFTSVFAFAVFPAGLRRQIHARGWGARTETTVQEVIPANSHNAMAEPDLSGPQIEIPEELKRRLQQVLQTLEAQVERNLA